MSAEHASAHPGTPLGTNPGTSPEAALRGAVVAALDVGDHQLAGELLEVIRRRAPGAPVVDLGTERARRRSR